MRVIVEDGTERVVIEGGKASVEMPEPWDGSQFGGMLVKAESSKRSTLVVAYPVYKADHAVAMDGHRDFAGAEALEEAAHSFLTKSPHIGLFHEDGTTGAGETLESYLWPADPWTLKAADGSPQTVVPGDWLLKIRWSEPAWDMILSGRIKGVSMQGSATRRLPSRESLARLRR